MSKAKSPFEILQLDILRFCGSLFPGSGFDDQRWMFDVGRVIF
jgi:hypothetical protein